MPLITNAQMRLLNPQALRALSRVAAENKPRGTGGVMIDDQLMETGLAPNPAAERLRRGLLSGKASGKKCGWIGACLELLPLGVGQQTRRKTRPMGGIGPTDSLDLY